MLGDSSGLASTRSLLWRSVLLGWLPTRPFRLCSRSLVDLAGHRVTVPRACPRRGAAVWAPLHSVCVLLARPMFRGTRLPGACYVVHLVVSRRSADCGPACWARAHRGTAHADVLLRYCSSRCSRSRPCSPLPLVSDYVAPPGCYHGSRLSGGRAAWHFISRSCPLVVRPGPRSVKQRSDPESSCLYREVRGLARLCPCIRLLL